MSDWLRIALGIGAAMITAVVSLVVAIISQRASRRNLQLSGMQAKELAALQGALQEQQAETVARIADERARQDARMEYEYKARIRLYEEYEPLLFQLIEASESAFYRVFNLARAAREGYIREDGSGWLTPATVHERYETDNYYLNSTIYKILHPLAVFATIRRSMTLVDLTVDPRIAREYDYAKCLYYVLSDDFRLARDYDPQLPYEPFAQPWETLRSREPAKYWRQGTAIGRIDNMVDSLILDADKAKQRPMTLGQFTLAMSDPNSQVYQNVEPFSDLLVGFHPATRPVLWRILITKAHLYQSLMRSKEAGLQGEAGASAPWTPLAIESELVIDWRMSQSPVPDAAIREPFVAAEAYLRRNLPEAGGRVSAVGAIR